MTTPKDTWHVAAPEEVARVWETLRRIRLLSSTRLEPDFGPPSACGPTDFAIEVVFDGLTYLSTHSQVFHRIAAAGFEELLELADAALDEGGGSVGIDTALSRPVTNLALSAPFVEASGERRRYEEYTINHYGSDHEIPKSDWPRLLQRIGERLHDDLAGQDLRHLDFLLDRFPVSEPAEGYASGRVVSCAGGRRFVRVPVCSYWSSPTNGAREVERRVGCYLRVGQPPDPSPLFLLRLGQRGIDVVRQDATGECVTTLSGPKDGVSRWDAGASLDLPFALEWTGGSHVLLNTYPGPTVYLQRAEPPTGA